MLPSPLRALMARLTLVVAVASFACGQRCSSPAPPIADLPGLARMLAEASGAIDVDEIAWQPSRGVLADALWGRWVLFTARPVASDQRDVFRARVSVSYEGGPIAVRAVGNLTRTPLGDERQLQVNQHTAAFVADAEGVLQGVTVLRFAGAPASERSSMMVRGLLSLHNFLESGSWHDPRPVHLTIPDATAAQLKLEPDRLTLAVDDRTTVRLPLSELRGVGTRSGVRFSALTLSDESWSTAWRESVGLLVGRGLVLRVDRLRDAAQGALKARLEAPAVAVAEPIPPSPERAGEWPPRPISLLITPGWEGEGSWRSADLPWPEIDDSGRRIDPFLQTFVRPDAERPDAVLRLIAMDMRRLELRLEAGYLRPRPQTGPPGPGALLEDAGVLRRVRATFNGGLGNVGLGGADLADGMMVNHRILVPPAPAAASLILSDDGRAALGNWPSTAGVPSGIRSFRQSREALVIRGQVNQELARRWKAGGGSTAPTERSALCLADNGHLYYGFGDRLTAETLARGLQHAGCQYAMHLDMAPGHCGFFYNRIAGLEPSDYEAQAAWPGLQVPAERFGLRAPRDFFYVVEREPKPRGELKWALSPGVQPEPRSPAAILTAVVELGALEVSLLRVDAGRLSWHLLAGSDEPLIAGRPAPVRQLPEGYPDPVIAINLGRTTSTTRLGLAFDSDGTLPLGREHATLLLGSGRPGSGGVEVIVAGQERAPLRRGQAAAQLPQLAVAGELLPRAVQTGERRVRGALCVEDDGTLLLASALHDSSDVLALALRGVGCDDVLELDRGSRDEFFVHRAGTPDAPNSSYNTTVLVGSPRDMAPRTFSWNR